MKLKVVHSSIPKLVGKSISLSTNGELLRVCDSSNFESIILIEKSETRYCMDDEGTSIEIIGFIPKIGGFHKISIWAE